MNRRLTYFLLAVILGWFFLHVRGSDLLETHEESAITKAYLNLAHIQGRLSDVTLQALEKISSRGTADFARLRRRQHQSPAYLSELAALELGVGRPNKAISLLEDALRETPQDISIRIDLSAAYLTRGVNGEDLRDVAKGLALAEGILLEEPQRLEALFNRALALEHLALLSYAKASWREYLQIDKVSIWSNKARARLQALVRPTEEMLWHASLALLEGIAPEQDHRSTKDVVRRFPHLMRRYVEEQRLGRWAQLSAMGESVQARAILQEAWIVGHALLEISGDRMILDSVQAIEGAGGSKLWYLMSGHKEFHAALSLYQGDQIEDAESKFLKAESLLRAAGSPFHLWAKLYRAIACYSRSDYEAALAILGEMETAEVWSGYPSLGSRVLWIRGMCYLAIGDPAESARSYLKALTILKSIEDEEGIGVMHHLLAENFRYLGDDDRAWKHRRQALLSAPQISEKKRLYAIFDETANAILKLGFPRIALYFRDSVLHIARQRPDQRGVAFALMRRAETYSRLNERTKALADLGEARQLCEGVTEEASRQYLKARLNILEGQVRFGNNEAQALSSLSQAIEYYLEVGNRFPLTTLYRLRAAKFRTLGRRAEEREDLLKAIQEFEKQRRYLTDEERLVYFVQARETFEFLVKLEIDEGHLEDAYIHAEQVRARSLLDKWLSNRLDLEGREEASMPLLSPTEVAEELGSDVKIVEYMVVQGRLLIWVIGHKEVHLVSRLVDEEELMAVVESLKISLRQKSYMPWRQLNRLYGEVIFPVRHYIRRGDTLVIIPDKMLYSVPFAALMDSKRRFLVEDFSVSVAPSAMMYLEAERQQAVTKFNRDPEVLIIANPASSAQGLEWLPSLSAAEGEAREVANLYPAAHVRLLQRAEATKSAFLALSGGFDIIHFGGHAISNSDFPALSRLVMASEEGGSALYSFEIGDLRLASTRLVVLAACRSGDGMINGSEGLMSLGYSFFRAGVPSVVVSSWPINDRLSSLFWVDFHGSLQNGRGVSRALRSAQLKELGRCRKPSRCIEAWAGFHVLGAS